MRILIVCILILFFIPQLHSQTISVQNIETVNSIDDGLYYFPRFSPDGSKLVFTSVNYKGIFYYDFENKSIVQLNDYPGAGFNPIFSKDGLNVIFRRDIYVKRRKFSSIILQNFTDQKEIIIDDANRYLTSPKISMRGNIVYKRNSKITGYNIKLDKTSQDVNGNFLFLENKNLVIYENGTPNIPDNLEEGNFAWPSISTDQTKLLFTKAGEGTFISDLSGNILVELGYANAPVWSPDSKWIAYMVDSDNGHFYTASDIYVVSSDGEKKYQLTDTEYNIEMYPQWSSDGNKIVFHTTNGIIKILQLEVE